MQLLLITIIAVHVLASIFWAGTTFALARLGGANAARLFRPQLGAAAVAATSGAILWGLTHAGAFGESEKILTVGVAAALTALAVQAVGVGRNLRAAGHDGIVAAPRIARAYRLSAGLLLVTVICMAIARYV